MLIIVVYNALISVAETSPMYRIEISRFPQLENNCFIVYSLALEWLNAMKCLCSKTPYYTWLQLFWCPNIEYVRNLHPTTMQFFCSERLHCWCVGNYSYLCPIFSRWPHSLLMAVPLMKISLPYDSARRLIERNSSFHKYPYDYVTVVLLNARYQDRSSLLECMVKYCLAVTCNNHTSK